VNTLSSIWRKHKQSLGFIPAIAPEQMSGAEQRATTPEQGEEWRFIARQAIFDTSQKVFGYELLARSGWENRFTGDSDNATRKMISDGVLYGFEGLTRGKRGFINCTRESLVDGLVTLLPKLTVLEVLETIAPDEEVITALKGIKELGYQIALDDFRISPNMDKLVELADYVKVDFRLSNAEERREILAYLSGSHATLIAEKIETEEEFKIAVEEGFHMFQGYFFCHPTVYMAKRAPATGKNYFRLFAALSQRELDFGHVANLLKSEVTLCYQLLRLVNSAAFGVSQPVRSVESALALAGEDQFRKLVLNAIAVETCAKHPEELLIRILQRARFLELLSPYTGEIPQEQYLFGLLSLMSDLLDSPIQDMIRTLPLRQEVKQALTGESNSVTVGLHLLECYEEGDWASCLQRSTAIGITESKVTHFYEESLQWAEMAAAPEKETARA
jgi:EAL and modified HD-GYP domain-containing signal transduction protein